MADVTLSSIKGGDGGGIRSRDLSGAVVTTTSSFILSANANAIFSAGATSANIFKEVINISGKGWLLSCAVRNSVSGTNSDSNIIKGKLIIDGIETVASTLVAITSPGAGIMFLGGTYSASVPQPSATPVRFEQGFSLQVTSSMNRFTSPFIGWHLLYLLD